ncbi:glycoside hydrolase family 15 protein [Pseudomonas typographi]|uniref:Glycoside hydrolase family 15 protein n=1 Tax=Pseudomonas typographi TaxID=2715964 RepID=A0ABR7Z7B0_9PSED|nr:glycoside hydrolase family 15 protein [Pseudomonas typographi]MBD1554017.1 glycoside hydrolase family 15 protein [Pseudomonas typographi]MBD1601267.1 glycoside hydrolase family 15 protein [Pseudomonas typographi]
MPALIEDYALIGNCRTAALIDKTGSLDWLCFPRFDGPACFAALLGTEENGRWRIGPAQPGARVSRRYRGDTLILETTFDTPSGRVLLIDCMPVGQGHNSVIRIVVGLDGKVPMAMDLTMRFDYGSSIPWVEQPRDRVLSAVAGPERLVLYSAKTLEARDHHTTSQFTVRPGDRLVFTLTHQPSVLPLADQFDAEQALQATEAYWLAFAGRCPDVGRFTEQVKRSLLTLKALTYEPSGGIVAAATTSLPERLGGERNWDYRFCWLRDATMTLLAFTNLGYLDEAHAWREWLLRSVAGSPEQMQIMYGLGGERRLPEYELDWLPGYEGSRPVRIGNAASTQTQLDVYGEVTDAMSQAIRGGMPRHPRSASVFRLIMRYLENAWQQPDEGIWEIRAKPRHFVHSKVMAWVAFDRAANLADLATEEGQGMSRHYRGVADRIHAQVCEQGFDRELGHFVQSYGSKEVDASLLHIGLTGFLPADDPRFVATVQAVESQLMKGGFVLRYLSHRVDDGLTPGEGTFLVCSFWLADVYALLGRMGDAQAMFERLSGLCNDVGLLAEQYDQQGQRMLGNFPQAFSHIGIINTALNLHRAECPAQVRARREAQAPVQQRASEAGG